jgi:hypothetical protein
MAMSEDLVSAETLADWFGCSAVNVRDLAKRGVIERTTRGRYPLKEGERRYCASLPAAATGKGGGTASDERKRLAPLRHRWPSSARLRDKGPYPRVENAGAPPPEVSPNFPVS